MGKNGTYHHGDLRRALLDASIALVEEAGIGALSLREVARKAGVSHNAPYHHFPDKGTLLAALAEDGHEQLAREMSQARMAADTPRARLEACGLAYVRFALSRPAHFQVMCRPELASESRLPVLSELAAGAFNMLIQSVVDCQASGDAPAGDPMPLVLTCWSAVHGLATLWLDGPLAQDPKGFVRDPDQTAVTLVKVLSDLLFAAARQSSPASAVISTGKATDGPPAQGDWGNGRKRRIRSV